MEQVSATDNRNENINDLEINKQNTNDSDANANNTSEVSTLKARKSMSSLQKLKLRKSSAISRMQMLHSVILIQTKFRCVIARARVRLKKQAQEEAQRLALIQSGRYRPVEPLVPSEWPPVVKEEYYPLERPQMGDSVISYRWICKHKKFFIRTITWNLCGQSPPPPEETCKFLIPGSKYHMYLIGSEECERTIAQSAINPSKRNWEEYLARVLGSDYVPIRSHTLQAIHLIAFAHYTVARYIQCVGSGAISTGIGNTLGNKGGVGIYFLIGNTSFCFVNAHCAAHQNAVKQRNSDCNRICAELPKVLFRKCATTVKYLSTRIGQVLEKFSDEAILGIESKNSATNSKETTDKDDSPIGLAALDSMSAAEAKSSAQARPSTADSKDAKGGNENIDSNGDGLGPSLTKAEEKDKVTKSVSIDDSVQNKADSSENPFIRLESDSKSVTFNRGGDATEAMVVLNNRIQSQQKDEKDGLESITNADTNKLSIIDIQLNRLARSESLHDCADRVVFMGDLNYRIRGKRGLINQLLEKNMHEVLIGHDQLRESMDNGHVLRNFVEPPLHFRPTYKFDHNSDNYDTSKKMRLPAWTDRILYVDRGMQCIAYDGDFTLRSSDHRPVFATFVCDIDMPNSIDWTAPPNEQEGQENNGMFPTLSPKKMKDRENGIRSNLAAPVYKAESQVCSLM